MKYIPLLFVLFFQNIWAATFYVSASGNDANNGQTITTAWASINKINQGDYADNDIILFRRGDVFRGFLDVPNTGCTYGAYGTGPNPVISGAIPVLGWTLHSGNIYKATLAGTKTPNHLYYNGKLMTIARYPNTGWLKTAAGSPNKSTFSNTILAGLGRPNNYWNGASVHIRTFSWLFENRTVSSSQTNGTIVMNSDLTQTLASNINPGWGFFIDNKLSELDAASEWFYEPSTRTVYLYAPNGASPAAALVEASVEDMGIKIFFKNNVTIQNLTVSMQKDVGIQPYFGDGMKINNCIIEKCGNTGIQQPWNCKDLQITNNQIYDCLNYAIFWNQDGDFDNGANLIQGNTIKRIGMRAGYGGDGVVQYAGVRLRGKNMNFIKNTIDSTGYVCMLAEARNSLIEKNVFSHSQMLLDDGGALFVDANNQTIRNNFFLNSYGNRDESSGLYGGSPFRVMGMGIFTQPNYTGIVVENNVFAHNRDIGLYLDDHSGAKVSNNLMFNNKVQTNFTGNNGTKAISINNNTMYSLLPSQRALEMNDNPLDYANVFNNSFYANPYNKTVIRANNNNYTFRQWRAAFGGADINADSSKISFAYVDSLDAVSKHLFVTNPSDNPLVVDLQNKTYRNINGSYICTNTVTVGPWAAILLVLDAELPTPIYTAASALSQNLINPSDCNWNHVKSDNKNLVSVQTNNVNVGTFSTDTYLGSSQTINLGKTLSRNWVIKTSIVPSAPVNIRLYFTQSEFDALKAQDASIITINDLKIIKYSGTNEDNIVANNTSGNVIEINNGVFVPYQNGFYVQLSVASFSEFWITGKNTTLLSINTTRFNAKLVENNKVNLDFSVVASRNIRSFEIERSEDKVVFNKIKTIALNPNQVSGQVYNYQDLLSHTGRSKIYYRLKIINMDNSFVYSIVREVNLDATDQNFDVKIFPNPVKDVLNLDFIQPQDSYFSYQIHSLMGQSNQKLSSGKTIITNMGSQINVFELKSGVYFIRISTRENQKTLRFVKL